jgi:hypothetical protein
MYKISLWHFINVVYNSFSLFANVTFLLQVERVGAWVYKQIKVFVVA